MELWGHVQNIMEASGVHQLLAQLEQKMQEDTIGFAEEMYKYVDDFVGQLEKTLAAYWEEIKALQEQIPILQQQNNLTGTRMVDMQKRLEDIRVSQVKFATDLMEETRKALSVEIDGKVTTVRAELQQQVNETHQHLQETLEEIKKEVATVSQSQERMWEVTSRMGEDVKSIMESAGTGNHFSIPENDENPDVPADEGIPLD